MSGISVQVRAGYRLNSMGFLTHLQVRLDLLLCEKVDVRTEAKPRILRL